MRLILLIPFFSLILCTGCMQSENSHSSNKTQNNTIKQSEELNEIMEKIDNGDTSVELTISQKAYTVIKNNCMNCHRPYHIDWEITDSHWLADSVYNFYIKPHDSQPENPRSARIIDRLATHGTGSLYGAANMPENGTLSEDDFNTLEDWVEYLIEEKNK